MKPRLLYAGNQPESLINETISLKNKVGVV